MSTIFDFPEDIVMFMSPPEVGVPPKTFPCNVWLSREYLIEPFFGAIHGSNVDQFCWAAREASKMWSCVLGVVEELPKAPGDVENAKAGDNWTDDNDFRFPNTPDAVVVASAEQLEAYGNREDQTVEHDGNHPPINVVDDTCFMLAVFDKVTEIVCAQLPFYHIRRADVQCVARKGPDCLHVEGASSHVPNLRLED